MRDGIRFHRYAVEISDRKFLEELRRLYGVHRLIIGAKKRSEPLVDFEEISFAEFTIRVLQFGLEAMKCLLEQKGSKSQTKDY